MLLKKFAVCVNNTTILYYETSENELNGKFRDAGKQLWNSENVSRLERGAEQFTYIIETHLHFGKYGGGGEWRMNLASSKWPNNKSAKTKDFRKEQKCIFLIKKKLLIQKDWNSMLHYNKKIKKIRFKMRTMLKHNLE